MIAAAAEYRHAVVIGGGLLGLEAANGLRARGMDVTVVHLMPWLMERQLDRTAADLLQTVARGARASRSGWRRRPRRRCVGAASSAAAVRGGAGSPDGENAAADLVVMAVGIRPNTALAQSAGLHCDRGIVVNDTLQTFDPRIYAVGECVSHRGVAYGLVAPLFEMAKVCANHLAQARHRPLRRLASSRPSSRSPASICSRPAISPAAPTPRRSCSSDPGGGVYKKLVLKDDTLVGGVLYGDTVDGAWYFKLLRDGANVARHPRPADVRRVEPRRHRPPGAESSAAAMAGRRWRSAAATACARARSSRRSRTRACSRSTTVRKHTKASSLLRLVHRPGRADPDGHRRRRLLGRAEAEADVRLHRPHAPGGARRDPRAAAAVDRRRCDAVPRVAHAQRLRDLPAGAQLLPDLDLAAARRRTIRSRASSTSARTPTSRRTAPSRWCRACGAARPTPPSCAASPTSSTSTRSRRSR